MYSNNLGYNFVLLSCCRRHKEKKEETTEPDADPERDQRTVFAYQVFQIHLECNHMICS